VEDAVVSVRPGAVVRRGVAVDPVEEGASRPAVDAAEDVVRPGVVVVEGTKHSGRPLVARRRFVALVGVVHCPCPVLFLPHLTAVQPLAPLGASGVLRSTRESSCRASIVRHCELQIALLSSSGFSLHPLAHSPRIQLKMLSSLVCTFALVLQTVPVASIALWSGKQGRRDERGGGAALLEGEHRDGEDAFSSLQGAVHIPWSESEKTLTETTRRRAP
jgi:hypothetical protein